MAAERDQEFEGTMATETLRDALKKYTELDDDYIEWMMDSPLKYASALKYLPSDCKVYAEVEQCSIEEKKWVREQMEQTRKEEKKERKEYRKKKRLYGKAARWM